MLRSGNPQTPQRNSGTIVSSELITFHRGSKPHASHDDPTDPKDVVSVRIKDDGLKTFRRLHIHQDGSVKRIDV